MATVQLEIPTAEGCCEINKTVSLTWIHEFGIRVVYLEYPRDKKEIPGTNHRMKRSVS